MEHDDNRLEAEFNRVVDASTGAPSQEVLDAFRVLVNTLQPAGYIYQLAGAMGESLAMLQQQAQAMPLEEVDTKEAQVLFARVLQLNHAVQSLSLSASLCQNFELQIGPTFLNETTVRESEIYGQPN